MSIVRNLFKEVGEILIVTLKIVITVYTLSFLYSDAPVGTLDLSFLVSATQIPLVEKIWFACVGGMIFAVISKIFEYIGGQFEFPLTRKAIQERQSKKESWKDESERIDKPPPV